MSSRLYIVCVPLLYSIVFVLPLFSAYFQHQGQTTALFLMSFYWALASVFWPGLRSRHLLLTLPAYCLVLPIFLLLPVYETVALIVDPHLAEAEFEARTFPDFWLGLAFQTFSGLVAAVGLGFQAKRGRMIFRRAARDEDELMALFEIVSKAHENPDLSFYRYKTVLGRGFGLVAEQNGRIYGVVHGILLKDSLFIYALSTKEGAPDDLALELLHQFFRRGELPSYAGMSWFYWNAGEGKHGTEIPPEIQRRGFTLLTEDDPRLAAARELLDGGLGPALPMPVPLGSPRGVWSREFVSS